MKNKIAVALLLLITFGGIGTFFWKQEMVYQLPTPIPGDYQPVAIGMTLKLPPDLYSNATKPILLHFFNPDCPYSHFNLKHFLTLARTHYNEIDFIVVVPEMEDVGKVRVLVDKQIRIVPDTKQWLSKQCGVYSSPQAVLVNSDGLLYYKGNYNRARYCTQQKTSYTALAINQLLAHQPPPIFDTLATIAYGCQLPGRK